MSEPTPFQTKAFLDGFDAFWSDYNSELDNARREGYRTFFAADRALKVHLSNHYAKRES